MTLRSDQTRQVESLQQQLIVEQSKIQQLIAARDDFKRWLNEANEERRAIVESWKAEEDAWLETFIDYRKRNKLLRLEALTALVLLYGLIIRDILGLVYG